MVRDDGVAGVVLANGDEITARTVLSSADPARTIGMIDPAWLDPEFTEAVRHIKFRGATSHVLYAVDDLPVLRGVTDPGRALVSVLSLSPTIQALERAADAGKYGRVPAQPHVEITAPSLRWPDLAPTGKHVIVARAACTPHTLRNGAAADGGWDDTARSALADAVTDAITCHAPGFADRVLHRAVLTPRDIERRFGCTEGAFTHGEMMLDQILFMRPVPGAGRYAMPIAGLFLCGAGAHPGPGIPGGPGWLGARHALAGGRTT
jgi:phytoene dehydrogenase-like protein